MKVWLGDLSVAWIQGLKPAEIRGHAGSSAADSSHFTRHWLNVDRRAITPTMSIRFGVFFNQSPEFWHGLQVECDFRALTKKRKQLTAKIQPARTLASAA